MTKAQYQQRWRRKVRQRQERDRLADAADPIMPLVRALEFRERGRSEPVRGDNFGPGHLTLPGAFCAIFVALRASRK